MADVSTTSFIIILIGLLIGYLALGGLACFFTNMFWHLSRDLGGGVLVNAIGKLLAAAVLGLFIWLIASPTREACNLLTAMAGFT